MRVLIATAVAGVCFAAAAGLSWASDISRKGRDQMRAADFSGARVTLERAPPGDADARSVLAYLYATGTGGPRDRAKARELARAAARERDPIALYVLAFNDREEVGQMAPEYVEPAIRALLRAALAGDSLAQGLLPRLVFAADTPIPENAWPATGVPPAARRNPSQYFAASSIRAGYGMGYFVLTNAAEEGPLDLEALGPGGEALAALRTQDSSGSYSIRYTRRGALLGDGAAMSTMDEARFPYTAAAFEKQREFAWGKRASTDREETPVALGFGYAALRQQFKGGAFDGDCAAATDAIDFMVVGIRRLNAPLAKLGVIQAMTASPPRELTSQQKQQLVQQFGGDGNLGGLLVDFAASLHKVRVACGNDRFVPLMVRRLAG